MTDIFAAIFELLSLYSKDLGEHLRGFNLRCKAYDAGAFYNTIGLVSILSPLFFSLMYYLVIDRPKLSKIITWFLFGLVSGLIPFIWAYVKVSNDVANKMYCKELQITSGDTWGWALTVLLWTLVFYFIYSLVIKNFSTNCKRIPF
ncbi:MAG: hypothetical protein NZ519_01550 [Bacteroidia bacterium]|nr:hypothetical protein [Bacteroidia bacterium]